MKWQPIETAPRGSGENGPERVDHPEYIPPPRLLLSDGRTICVGYYDWFYHKGYGEGAWDRNSPWCDAEGNEILPTHWMALPELPSKENG